MATTPHDGLGTTFVFANGTYTVTSISYNVSPGRPEIDVSHLGLTAGSYALTMQAPLVGDAGGTGKEVSMDFFGATPVVGGTTGTLIISGGITYTGIATCSSSSVTATVNEVMKGQASFKVQ